MSAGERLREDDISPTQKTSTWNPAHPGFLNGKFGAALTQQRLWRYTLPSIKLCFEVRESTTGDLAAPTDPKPWRAWQNGLLGKSDTVKATFSGQTQQHAPRCAFLCSASAASRNLPLHPARLCRAALTREVIGIVLGQIALK